MKYVKEKVSFVAKIMSIQQLSSTRNYIPTRNENIFIKPKIFADCLWSQFQRKFEILICCSLMLNSIEFSIFDLISFVQLCILKFHSQSN